MRGSLFLFLVVLLASACPLFLFACQSALDRDSPSAAKYDSYYEGHDFYKTWRVRQGDPRSNSYSKLDQINRGNVQKLEVAWTYHAGSKGKSENKKSKPERENGSKKGAQEEKEVPALNVNPIVVDGVMYVVSPDHEIVALDAATGEELWTHRVEKEGRLADRGVMYWESEDGRDRRILFAVGPYLVALGAETGVLITRFGDEGYVDLRKGLGRDPEDVSLTVATPGIVYQDLVIMGSAPGEGYNAAPGDVRAYDVRTGERAWTFHTIPRPGEFGYGTWPEGAWKRAGGANVWAGFSLDVERGMVFLPTGAPTYHFYGADRKGKNLFGNSVVALNARTGERIWHFQTVHHDLWDYDLASPPNLVTVEHEGQRVDAVAQVTKQGFVFLLDRETGEPVSPVEERPVPASTVPGEEAWPTQPVPVKLPPIAQQTFTGEYVFEVTASGGRVADTLKHFEEEDLQQLRKARYEGLFTPPSRQGTIMLPGSSGGASWGGASFDPATGLLYVNTMEVPTISKLEQVKAEPSEASPFVRGKTIYQQNCASCHRVDREGNPPAIPSLTDVEDRLSRAEVAEVIENGRERMPSFSHLSKKEVEGLEAYLFDREEQKGTAADSVESIDPTVSEEEKDAGDDELRFVSDYNYMTSKEGYPPTKPPWATLNAVNLNTGKIAWQVPLGEYPELPKRGIPPTGTGWSMGGPFVTAGGLVFIAATQDGKFRAFDKKTGEVLWETALPTNAIATPSTYEIDGKQYVVITAGGGHGEPPGDAYVAFALPSK